MLKLATLSLRKQLHVFLLSLIGLFGLLAISGQTGHAKDTPGTIVANTVSNVQSAVRTKKSSLSASEMDAVLREIIAPVFDFNEMSRRCLGTYWTEITPGQRTAFQDMFSELLAKNYLKQIRERADNSVFSQQAEKVRGKKAVVQTSVKSEGEEIKLDYRMIERDNTWKVYDVIIENIGLISNYRSEFADIIRKSGMNALLTKLKEKLANEA